MTTPPLDRHEIISVLRLHGGEFAAKFGVVGLGLFGSAARDELRADSDVDVLVEFAERSRYDTYFGLKDRLEALIGRPVDLVTTAGLKPRARTSVERDLVRVA